MHWYASFNRFCPSRKDIQNIVRNRACSTGITKIIKTELCVFVFFNWLSSKTITEKKRGKTSCDKQPAIQIIALLGEITSHTTVPILSRQWSSSLKSYIVHFGLIQTAIVTTATEYVAYRFFSALDTLLGASRYIDIKTVKKFNALNTCLLQNAVCRQSHSLIA